MKHGEKNVSDENGDNSVRSAVISIWSKLRLPTSVCVCVAYNADAYGLLVTSEGA
jgi:hypothetical protein